MSDPSVRAVERRIIRYRGGTGEVKARADVVEALAAHLFLELSERQDSEVRLDALLEAIYFRSFAELSVGCFAPRPDHLGVASRVVRALLGKCTPERTRNRLGDGWDEVRDCRYGSLLAPERAAISWSRSLCTCSLASLALAGPARSRHRRSGLSARVPRAHRAHASPASPGAGGR